jgi:hypothetical protein
MTSSMTGAGGFGNQTPKGYSPYTIQADPRIQQLFGDLYGGSKGGIAGGLGHLSQLAQGGTPEFWQQLEAPAFRQFDTLQGNVASRFSGMGSGARRSSGFQNEMSSASSDFAERLQANRQALRSQAISELLGLGQNLLGTQLSASGLVQKQKPWWQEFLGGLGIAGGEALGLGGGLGLAGKFLR